MSLIAHCGARVVTLDELRAIPAPEGTRTWFPVPHAQVVDAVGATLKEAGFLAARAVHALARGDQRYFGTIDLESYLAPGVGLSVGVRSSTDKSLPLGFCAGSRVFVCDNLAFSSEVVVKRKHTRFGADRYQEALSRAVQGLGQFREAEASRIRWLKAREVLNREAESLILRAYEQEVISHLLLPGVLREWRQPSFEEFQPRTGWSLFNAFTAAMGGLAQSNPQRHAHQTLQLSGLIAADLSI